MRKIVLHMTVSLDGFFEGPDRDIGWHLVDDELHTHVNEHLAPMSAFLEGRVTYELMEEFWPTADQDPEITPPMSGVRRDLAGHAQDRLLAHPGACRLERRASGARWTPRRSARSRGSRAATWPSAGPTSPRRSGATT